ncbi:acyltransferase [Lachnoclostridium phocaeense]|uniref:acyltransferase n=1 Tax=Lachnoclostridium phocaeense TaxID=1871021 RepID=UPI00248DA1F0|nr:acyltransferase [Lachnoclostridium phocaeense]
MSSFYSEKELEKIGFKNLGHEVLISKKASIYSPEKISIGSHVRIDDFCILSGTIKIGNYIHIAAYSALYGGLAGIYIEDFSNISSRVSIYSVSDDYSGGSMTNPMVPEEYKKVTSLPVYLRKHVIIGASSVILPGVELKEGSSFGSFSLINQGSEEWSINVGIPCKKIKDRERNILQLEQKLKKYLI